MITGKTIVVWFSCGAASAVALMKTIELYGEENTVLAVNNPVINEDEDNIRFKNDVSKWLNIEIQECINPKYPSCDANDVWKDRRFMSGPNGAPCTLELKKRARQNWEKTNRHDFMVMGFTKEEEQRHFQFKMFERDNILPVLIQSNISKADCYLTLLQAGIALPNVYKMGYPNANCIGCVKATSPTYWNHVRKVHPAIFDERAKLSREVGARLVRVKGNRIFLDELDPAAKGRPMKNMDFECGIFCEEKAEIAGEVA